MLLYVFSLTTAFFLTWIGARRRRLRIGGLPGSPEKVSLAYSVLGPLEGEPWLLLHGLGSVGSSWLPVMAALRRECRLVVPELSALGGTRAPGGGLGIRQGAAAMAQLLEAELDGRPVTVCGLSLGGWMAVRLALARPDLVSRLVLIDAGGYLHQDWDRVQELVTLADIAGVERLYRALFVRAPWVLRHSKAAFLAAYTSPGVKNILSGTEARDAFADADLARLAMPAALIWGEHDGLFPLATAEAMARAFPHATLTVIPSCGHAVHWECPDRLVAAIQEFRRSTSPGLADLA
ncbi:MAG TPA: alpha/beta hydrolase [Thermoanaerobaculia bacterium]|jgi:pimeloyl-ACP methyl ester carboxylesterase|nr:alpha/beta hydrolase [Thermoanaerobaculia bacterium]